MLASRRRVTSLGRQGRSGGTGARSLGRRGAGELARFRAPLPFSPLNGWSPSASHAAKPLPRHSPRGVHTVSPQSNYAESAPSQVGWRRNRGDDADFVCLQFEAAYIVTGDARMPAWSVTLSGVEPMMASASSGDMPRGRDATVASNCEIGRDDSMREYLEEAYCQESIRLVRTRILSWCGRGSGATRTPIPIVGSGTTVGPRVDRIRRETRSSTKRLYCCRERLLLENRYRPWPKRSVDPHAHA